MLRCVSRNPKHETIGLIGEAPEGDLLLVQADRLNTNGITGNAALERFTGMPDGTVIIRQFGGFEYQWTLEYGDGSGNEEGEPDVRYEWKPKPSRVPEHERDA